MRKCFNSNSTWESAFKSNSTWESALKPNSTWESALIQTVREKCSNSNSTRESAFKPNNTWESAFKVTQTVKMRFRGTPWEHLVVKTRKLLKWAFSKSPGTIRWPKFENAQNGCSGNLLEPFGGQDPKGIKINVSGCSWAMWWPRYGNCRNQLSAKPPASQPS